MKPPVVQLPAGYEQPDSESIGLFLFETSISCDESFRSPDGMWYGLYEFSYEDLIDCPRLTGYAGAIAWKSEHTFGWFDWGLYRDWDILQDAWNRLKQG